MSCISKRPCSLGSFGMREGASPLLHLPRDGAVWHTPLVLPCRIDQGIDAMAFGLKNISACKGKGYRPPSPFLSPS